MAYDSVTAKLDFRPGFHRESTRYAEEGSWYDGNRVRFREGRPENMRGYNKRVATAFDGIARDLLTWSDNDTEQTFTVNGVTSSSVSYTHLTLPTNREV